VENGGAPDVRNRRVWLNGAENSTAKIPTKILGYEQLKTSNIKA
jgi:hypothetical protein